MTTNLLESRAIFSFGSDAPCDLLLNAASVTRFLCDVADCMHNEGGAGLSEEGAHGLFNILSVVENTIGEALTKI